MWKRWVGMAVLLAVSGAARAEEKDAAAGRQEYLNSCAVCHGADGRAGTPFGRLLKVEPPSLRQLSKNNGGSFPLFTVYQTIDGRLPMPGHGPREMPVWGQRYSFAAAPGVSFEPYRTEAAVRERIVALIDYLYTLQD